ncbi:hypothetical protein, conserved in T. vivax [Trypanosoma vivax Y486]|uniref:Uncharacterized protein n=1 Tax=Trypanosoma vivax (strain Y486) TaxID=1055687 RepID=F9WU38_TRYVY|nr:hypothetical protein, conserved in T. vivax [Trypanosoma vivax Y486]|eukprot:CCD21085.1 hypothetical protein, conserved in T. vivax [Trypanosoma vivax Y486]
MKTKQSHREVATRRKRSVGSSRETRREKEKPQTARDSSGELRLGRTATRLGALDKKQRNRNDAGIRDPKRGQRPGQGKQESQAGGQETRSASRAANPHSEPRDRAQGAGRRAQGASAMQGQRTRAWPRTRTSTKPMRTNRGTWLRGDNRGTRRGERHAATSRKSVESGSRAEAVDSLPRRMDQLRVRRAGPQAATHALQGTTFRKRETREQCKGRSAGGGSANDGASDGAALSPGGGDRRISKPRELPTEGASFPQGSLLGDGLRRWPEVGCAKRKSHCGEETRKEEITSG